MPWKHVVSPTLGMDVDTPSSLLKPQASPNMKGVYISHGKIKSDFGMTDFPVESGTATNELYGTVMSIKQFFEWGGTAHLLAMTTALLYEYNTSNDTWDVISIGIELDDCEAAWDAKANVTSTADTDVFLRDSKSAKHVIAAGFTTGIVSSEDDLQNVDISAATNTHLTYWIRSTIDIAAEVFSIRLDEQAAAAAGATYADYFVPALTANKWKAVSVPIASPDADDGGTYPDDLNALASIGLIANSDPGACTIYIDDVRTTQNFTGDEDNRFSTDVMNDTFLLTNGIDALQKITAAGGILTVAVLGVALATGTISTSEILLAFKDHVVAFNNTENSATVPSRASWTNIGKIDDWTGGTAGYQDLVSDESWIMAVEKLSDDEAIIYKERSIVKMVWVGGMTPFRFIPMVQGIGAISKDGIVTTDRGHIVAGAEFVYSYSGGAEYQMIDLPIRASSYGRFDRTYLNRPVMFYIEEDSEVQLWFPTSTVYPDEGWCIDIEKGGWYRKKRSITGFGFYSEQSTLTIGDLVGTIGEQNFKFGDALTKSNTPMTLVGDENGKVYKLNKTTLNNDGTAIINTFDTPDFLLPDSGEYLNFFMRVPQLIFEARGQSITTFWSDDSGLTWNPTQGAGGHVTTLDSVFRFYQQDFDTVSRKIRFRFYNETVSSGFELQAYGFFWTKRSGRR